MAMEPYSEHAAATYKLNSNDNWLRQRQALALPVLPPTTSEARQYFFSNIRKFASYIDTTHKGNINYEAFAQEWNRSADGTTRFYITTEVLRAYAKIWEKINNIRASKELISDKLELIGQSREIFAAPHSAFPTFLTGLSHSTHPNHGVIDLDQIQSIPPSLSTELAISRPSMALPVHSTLSQTSMDVPNITPVSGSTNIPELAISQHSVQEINKDTRYVCR
jgi:hypothetical protein